MANASIVTILNVLIGGLITYIIYKYAVHDRYYAKKQNSRHARIKYSVGVIAVLAMWAGLSLVFGEILLNVFLGYKINSQRMMQGVVNIVFVPIILALVSFLLTLFFKEKSSSVVEGGNQSEMTVKSGSVAATSKRSFAKIGLLITVVLLVLIGYYSINNLQYSSSRNIYDFYSHVKWDDCESPFKSEPYVSFQFQYKKETNEIFATSERYSDGKTTKEVQSLSSCSIVDSKNWTCGGNWEGIVQKSKFSMVNGEFFYERGFNPVIKTCTPRVVKR